MSNPIRVTANRAITRAKNKPVLHRRQEISQTSQ
jgi:hypothetical protein